MRIGSSGLITFKTTMFNVVTLYQYEFNTHGKRQKHFTNRDYRFPSVFLIKHQQSHVETK